MPRELFNTSFCKVRGYAFNEKTAHRAAKCLSERIGSRGWKTRVLGVTIDDRLSWSHQFTDVKRNLVNKLNLLKRKGVRSWVETLNWTSLCTVSSIWIGLLGRLPWCGPSTFTGNTSRIIYIQLTLRYAYWGSIPTFELDFLTFYYKLRLIKLLHSLFIGEAPAALSYLTNKPCTAYNVRRSNNIIGVSRFKTLLAIEALSFGTLSWLILRGSLLIFIVKWRRTFILRNLILGPSRSSRCQDTTKILNASKYFMP